MVINIRRILSFVLIVFLLVSVMFAAAATENPQPPMDAFEAISSALEADAELGSLRVRESNALRKLLSLREDPSQALDVETAELISDIHMIWARFTARSREVASDVLRAIIAIDTELCRQASWRSFWRSLRSGSARRKQSLGRRV